jgi:hypothetical protein
LGLWQKFKDFKEDYEIMYHLKPGQRYQDMLDPRDEETKYQSLSTLFAVIFVMALVTIAIAVVIFIIK